jgi:hypothetical protein
MIVDYPEREEVEGVSYFWEDLTRRHPGLPQPVRATKEGCCHYLEFQAGERRLFLDINFNKGVEKQVPFVSRLEGGNLPVERCSGNLWLQEGIELLIVQFQKLYENT